MYSILLLCCALLRMGDAEEGGAATFAGFVSLGLRADGKTKVIKVTQPDSDLSIIVHRLCMSVFKVRWYAASASFLSYVCISIQCDTRYKPLASHPVQVYDNGPGTSVQDDGRYVPSPDSRSDSQYVVTVALSQHCIACHIRCETCTLGGGTCRNAGCFVSWHAAQFVILLRHTRCGFGTA
jgi:hypothetical protein